MIESRLVKKTIKSIVRDGDVIKMWFEEPWETTNKYNKECDLVWKAGDLEKAVMLQNLKNEIDNTGYMGKKIELEIKGKRYPSNLRFLSVPSTLKDVYGLYIKKSELYLSHFYNRELSPEDLEKQTKSLTDVFLLDSKVRLFKSKERLLQFTERGVMVRNMRDISKLVNSENKEFFISDFTNIIDAICNTKDMVTNPEDVLIEQYDWYDFENNDLEWEFPTVFSVDAYPKLNKTQKYILEYIAIEMGKGGEFEETVNSLYFEGERDSLVSDEELKRNIISLFDPPIIEGHVSTILTAESFGIMCALVEYITTNDSSVSEAALLLEVLND